MAKRKPKAEPEAVDPTTAYARDVVEGRVVAGRLVRLACERHLRDLETGAERGLHFDTMAADTVFQFFALLRHSKGKWAGQPFLLAPWQQFVVGNLFGWKRADGSRRFRLGHLEVARKNGKTTLASGVGLALFVLDNEPGAEVYNVATKRDQARITHEESKAMVNATPALKRRVVVYKDNIHIPASRAKYEPLGADGDTLDGLNVHGWIGDELHAWKSRALFDVMETATGARRQPLGLLTTTAGYDRHSIWWERRELAIKVLEGVIADDSLFVYIATLDTEPHTDYFQSLPAMRQLDKMCTCNTVPTTLIVEQFAAACATHAISDIGAPLAPNDARNTPSGRRGREGCAEPVTSDGSSKTTQKPENVGPDTPPSGRRKTGKNATPRTSDGNSETANESCSGNGSGSTAFLPSSSRNCETNKADAAPCVSDKSSVFAWIMTTLQEKFGDSFASNATAQSVCSETLQKLYCEHSDTCSVRKNAEIKDGALAVVCPPDDWTDEKNWIKGNPNLGVSVKIEDLRAECEQAKATPGKQNPFKRLKLDMPTEQASCWLSLEQWDAGAGDVGWLELRAALLGRDCFAALDLASTIDLAALVLLFPLDGDKFATLPYFWIPRETAERRSREDRISYPLWEDEGALEFTEGDAVDQDFIRRRVNELNSDYRILELAADRWNAAQIITQLQGDGIDVKLFGQGFASMSGPAKEIERLVVGKRIQHGGHPVLRWCVANAACEQDAAGNVKPSKAKSTGRIDGVVALTMTVGRAMAAPVDAGPPVVTFI